MNESKVKRIDWVDVAKGIGIFLVVLGHTSSSLRSFIYGFHMPLFFFLSGVVFLREKFTSSGLMKSRFNSLIIPYIFFYLITYVYWLFVERSMRSFEIEWWQPLLGLFYGSQWHDLMIHNGILWFLPCLFLTQVLVYLVGGVKNTYIQILSIFIFVVVGTQFKENLPWGLNIALVASQFFYIAWKIKRTTYTLNIRVLVCFILMFFLFTIYIVGKQLMPNRVNMGECIYSNVPLFEFFAYIGIVGTVLLSSIIVEPVKKPLIWLGKNSLVIFAIHQPVSRIVRFILERSINGVDVKHSIFYSITVSVVIIALLWPIILLYNKYCKPLITKFYIK